VGTLLANPVSGRRETVVADPARTAVLIGDSQSAGAAGVPQSGTWPVTALASLGYTVSFSGRGGTGFVAANPPVGNYPDALEQGNWHIPYGNVPLVVIEGGGNDASRGATDVQILANAERLLTDLKTSYPASRIVMVGTLGRGSAAGANRRSDVDGLLGGFAARHGIPFIGAGDWITRFGLANKMADAVHLTPAGHRILRTVLARRLQNLGVDGPAPAGNTAVVVRSSAGS
jgi:acyl-CoA thioesterase-1